MPNNYVLLETIALTQSAASVTFDNLPTSGYTDLKIVGSTRDTNGTANIGTALVTFNGSAVSYTQRRLYGSGSGSASNVGATTSIDAGLGGGFPTAGNTANTFGSFEMYIPNYNSTSTYKSVSIDAAGENNATAAYAGFVAGLWSSNNSITTVGISALTAFAAGSTFSLYGIAAYGTTPVLAPKATGGNIVANDGTYWYHAFTSSGNFVPQVGLTAEMLVVAGGGAGGPFGGGGGAGGVVAFTSQSLTATNYTITVGAGGGLGVYLSSAGGNGSNSSFQGLTAAVGGGGGGSANATRNGVAGGSGGGAGSADSGGVATGGGNTAGQGNVGGNAPAATSSLAAGGGGGAGGAGTSGSSSGVSAPAGEGTTAYSAWGLATTTGQNVTGTVYYAGGGYGYSALGPVRGGYGGGGQGGHGVAGVAGTPNTGGGGGAGVGTSGTGGSGIVIIRYPIA